RRAAGCAILLSTHNLDEAERLSDRVAVLQRRLLALDTPAALRRKLTTGRTLIRFDGDAAAHLQAARAFDAQASVDGPTLTVTPTQARRGVPELVRALAANGAQLIEVRPEMPDLEDVYLHLVGEEPPP